MAPRLPSDALRRRSPLRVATLAVAAVIVVAGISVGGVALAQTFKPGLNHPTVTVAPADTQPTLSASDLAAVQQAADDQQAKIAADATAKAAAEAAAAQAASDAAAAKKAALSGPVKCPAGSTADAADAQGNATLCFPDICFHLTLPDPAHPECVTAFKP